MSPLTGLSGVWLPSILFFFSTGGILHSPPHWAFCFSVTLLPLFSSCESALNYTCLPRVSQMWLKHNLHSWHIKHLISSYVNDCGCVIWVFNFFQITWIVCNYLVDACIWNWLQSNLRLSALKGSSLHFFFFFFLLFSPPLSHYSQLCFGWSSTTRTFCHNNFLTWLLSHELGIYFGFCLKPNDSIVTLVRSWNSWCPHNLL